MLYIFPLDLKANVKNVYVPSYEIMEDLDSLDSLGGGGTIIKVKVVKLP